MTEPEWLSKALILAIHDEQLAEHGGGTGVRDDGLLDSALARPQNRLAYDAAADLATWRPPTRSASRETIRSSMATSAHPSSRRKCF